MLIGMKIRVHHHRTLHITLKTGNILHTCAIAKLHAITEEEATANVIGVESADELHAEGHIHVGDDEDLVHAGQIEKHLVNTGTLDMALSVHLIPLRGDQRVLQIEVQRTKRLAIRTQTRRLHH